MLDVIKFSIGNHAHNSLLYNHTSRGQSSFFYLFIKASLMASATSSSCHSFGIIHKTSWHWRDRHVLKSYALPAGALEVKRHGNTAHSQTSVTKTKRNKTLSESNSNQTQCQKRSLQGETGVPLRTTTTKMPHTVNTAQRVLLRTKLITSLSTWIRNLPSCYTQLVIFINYHMLYAIDICKPYFYLK